MLFRSKPPGTRMACAPASSAGAPSISTRSDSTHSMRTAAPLAAGVPDVRRVAFVVPIGRSAGVSLGAQDEPFAQVGRAIGPIAKLPAGLDTRG